MNRWALLLAFAFSIASCSRSDAPLSRVPPRHERPSPAPTPPLADRRFSLVLGSVVAPALSQHRQTGGEVDYFLGYLALPDPGPRILWATGLVAPSAPRHVRVIQREALASGTLVLREYLQGKRRVVEASIGRAHLTVLSDREADVQALLAIARTYQAGNCSACVQPERTYRGAT